MSDRPRIVLGEEDFADEPETTAAAPAPSPSAVAPPPAAAPPIDRSAAGGALPPVVRGAPTPVTPDAAQHAAAWGAAGGAALTRDPRTAPLIAAMIGIALGWGLSELFGVLDIVARSETGLHAITGLWTAIVGACLGGALLAFDRAAAGAWDAAASRVARALLPLLAIGFASGFLANLLYVEIVKSIISDFGFLTDPDDARLYLARALGWAIFGAGVGGAVGLVDRSAQRAVNGAIGGAVGGAIGGAVFQYVALHMTDSQALARLLGLVAIGGAIALATRAVETVRREAWLHVVAGGMRGKEFILYHDVTRLGSSPECEVFLLKDAAIASEHARIALEGGRRLLTAAPEAVVLVDGAPVRRHQLRGGERLQLGSTVLAYSERLAASAPPAPHHPQSTTEGPWT